MRLLAELVVVFFVALVIWVIETLLTNLLATIRIEPWMVPLFQLIVAAVFAFLVSLVVSPFIRLRGR